jgi:hypothetical protein
MEIGERSTAENHGIVAVVFLTLEVLIPAPPLRGEEDVVSRDEKNSLGIPIRSQEKHSGTNRPRRRLDWRPVYTLGSRYHWIFPDCRWEYRENSSCHITGHK